MVCLIVTIGLGLLVDEDVPEASPDWIMAVKTGEIARIERLLEQGSPIDSVDATTRYTALHWATVEGDSAVVTCLIDHGADVKAVDQEGNMPLHLAARRGDRETVWIFLDRGMDVSTPNAQGDTPLILAAERGKTELVLALLERGAKPNERGHDQRTALMAAAYGGKKRVIRELVNHGADVNLTDAFGVNAMLVASRLDVVALLLREGGDLNPQKPLAPCLLTHAVENDNLSFVEWLIDRGADVGAQDPHGWNALMYALVGGHDALVTQLEELGAHMPENPSALLEFHAAMGHLDEVKRLLDAGISVDVKGPKNRTPLILATAHRKYETVTELLKRGADINAADERGTTALMAAVLNQDADLVALLLAEKPDVNAANSRGENALSIAKQAGNIQKIISLLRDAGADHLRDCSNCD